VRAGSDVLVADAPAEFAAAIARVCSDAELWRALSENGLRNVREHFSFERAREALERILRDGKKAPNTLGNGRQDQDGFPLSRE
jgi:glycosyltransferase involved in cell wall biosynthesis